MSPGGEGILRFATADFGDPLPEGIFSRVVIWPHFSLVRRESLRERRFREWLDAHPPGGRRGDWAPFLNGVRFLSYARGALHNRQFEFRLFHSGAVAFTLDIGPLARDNDLNLGRLREAIGEYALNYARVGFELLGVAGPVTIQVSLWHVAGLRGFLPPAHELADRIVGPTALETHNLSFTEESSVSEVHAQTDAVVSRLFDRLLSAFGLWPRAGPGAG